MFLLCVAFVAAGFSMVEAKPLVGYGCVAFFGLGAIVTGVALHPRSTYLEVTKDGFAFYSLFRRTFVPWTEVREFFPVEIRGHGMVGFTYAASVNRQTAARQFSVAISGAEGALPETYGVGAADLSAVLNALRSRHTP